jgi:hypothetical protein
MKPIANSDTIVLGGVYKTNLSIDFVRIIAFDKRQIYYDTWWEHCKDWGARNYIKKKYAYFRTSPQTFLQTAKLLRVEPLTEDEIKVYRPDLPFSMCRYAELSWTDKIYSTNKGYEKYLIGKSVDIKNITGLNIAEILLVPYGLKGAHKKSILIKAANGTNFSGIELLWQAHNAQAPYISGEAERGIGLHRLGFEKGIPSFYIGGYYDGAGLLKSI